VVGAYSGEERTPWQGGDARVSLMMRGRNS
jgi:hypothetical protein